MNKAKVLGITASLVLLLNTATAYAESISGVRSLNNEFPEIDYKTDITDDANSFNVKSGYKEIFGGSPERNLSSLSPLSLDKDGKLTTPISQKELSWLVEHNLLSRERGISVKGGKVTFGDTPDLYSEDIAKSDIKKSDFLMGLYKSVYGVLESRPIAFNLDSMRTAGEEYIYQDCKTVDGEKVCENKVAYKDPLTYQNVMGGENFKFVPQGSNNSKIGTFTEGDYYLYTDPNVKELYIKSLLDKGFIKSNDLMDLNFLNIYESGFSPSWSNKLPAFPMGFTDMNGISSHNITPSLPLGESFSISGVTSDSQAGPFSFSIEYSDRDYFTDETLTGMDALRYVEKIIRATEKDMTKTEATIVSYKYGVNYLSQFPDSDKDTLMFLTAKGILNFEDQTEYRNLYFGLTTEYAYKLMYRVANKDARLNFSQIQLTDSDNFWISKGFSQFEMRVNMNELSQNTVVPVVQTKSVVKESTSDKNTVAFIASTFAATDATKYKVVKIFDDPSAYAFQGTVVAKLKAGTSDFIEKAESTNGGYEVTFSLPASSGMDALRAINSQITFTNEGSYQTYGLQTVSKINMNGEDITLIPKSALESLNYRGTKIEVLEDKVLRNSATGATAILLPDNNMALIGTHVLKSEDLMVTPIGGEIYYNLAIIRTLLPNLYISDLDHKSIYMTNGMLKEDLIPVKSEFSDSDLGQTYLTRFETDIDIGRNSGEDNPAVGSDEFVSLSHLGLGSNVIIKDFGVKDENGENILFKIIINLQFKLPNADENFPNPIFSSSNPTHTQVHDFLYTPPTDQKLYDVWWNNIELTNGLLNAVYGSADVKYVKTGWVYPSISILYDKTSDDQIRLLKNFFIDAGNNISDEWFRRFTGRSKIVANDVVKGENEGTSYRDPGNEGGVYYPEKDLVVGMFPLWVHAMFNNPYASSDLNPDYVIGDGKGGTTTQGSGPKKANTTLWRNLANDRVLLYDSVITSEKGYKIYNLKPYVYIVSNGGQVYMNLYGNNFLKKGTTKALGNNDRVVDVPAVYIKTRTDSNSLQEWVGKTVTFAGLDGTSTANGIDFYVRGIYGNKISIVDTNRVTGTPQFMGNSLEIRGSTHLTRTDTDSRISETALEDRYESLRGLFTSNKLIGYDDSLTPWKGASSFIGTIGNQSEEPYISLNVPYTNINENTKVFYDSSKGGTTYNELGKVPVNGYVGLNLDQNLWTITDKGILFPRKTYPFLNVGSIYNTSITRNVIDSFLMKYNGTISVKDIPENYKLVVGDVSFYKKGNYFVSSPIKTNVNAAAIIANPKDKDAIKSWIKGIFTTVNINVANTANSSLINFISDIGLGDYTDDQVITNATLEMKGNIPMLYNVQNGKVTSQVYVASKLPVVNSIVVKLKLDDILMAHPFYTSKTYELLFSTAKFSEGSVDNLPFFSENLSFGTAVYDMLSGQQFQLKPLAQADSLKGQFLGLMKDKFNEGLITWVRATICVIISFLIILSWVVFASTRSGSATNVMYALGRSASKKNDVDLVSKISFGFYDIENPMGFVQLCVFNLASFLVLMLVWFVSW